MNGRMATAIRKKKKAARVICKRVRDKRTKRIKRVCKPVRKAKRKPVVKPAVTPLPKPVTGGTIAMPSPPRRRRRRR